VSNLRSIGCSEKTLNGDFLIFLGLEGCDMSPVGISYPSIIPDKQMTASSQYSNHYQPFYGRLHGLRGDGWCSKYPDRNDDWLQVDLGETVHVCAVATQGDVDGNEWVTDFKLSYSSDGNNWTPYKDGNGREVVRFIFLKMIYNVIY